MIDYQLSLTRILKGDHESQHRAVTGMYKT